jgi:hypothetical protein
MQVQKATKEKGPCLVLSYTRRKLGERSAQWASIKTAWVSHWKPQWGE